MSETSPDAVRRDQGRCWISCTLKASRTIAGRSNTSKLTRRRNTPTRIHTEPTSAKWTPRNSRPSSNARPRFPSSPINRHRVPPTKSPGDESPRHGRHPALAETVAGVEHGYMDSAAQKLVGRIPREAGRSEDSREPREEKGARRLRLRTSEAFMTARSSPPARAGTRDGACRIVRMAGE